MGPATQVLLGLGGLLALASASPIPGPAPQPFIEPFGFLSGLLGLGTSSTVGKEKEKKKEECPCRRSDEVDDEDDGKLDLPDLVDRTFHHKKKPKKPKKPCDCYGAPESGYGAPAEPVSVVYTYESLTGPSSYDVPASYPDPPHAPNYHVEPAPAYHAPEPAPAYHAPEPAYHPAPVYQPPVGPSYTGPIQYQSFEESPPQPLVPKFNKPPKTFIHFL